MAVSTSIFRVLADNFLGFDFIIFLMAGLNSYILIRTAYYSRKLYDTLNPYCWIPGGEASLKEIKGKFARQQRKSSETDIIQLRRRANTYYVFYENLTAIFPLMGLLGTVVSLLPMVEEIGEVATGLFFSALTSTMWGIIFAVIFKAMNGCIYSRIEDNEKNIEVYLQRNTDRLKAEAQSESVKEAVEEAAAEAHSEGKEDEKT